MASDHLQSLGEFLRQERERRGITLEQVASATKIGTKTLHALEGDQYRELPATPFIRGFVNSYCRFVGLNPQEVLTEFNTFITSKASDRPNREGGHSGYAFEKKEGEQSRTWLGIVMGGSIIVGGAIILLLKPSFKHSQHDSVAKLKSDHATPKSKISEAADPTSDSPEILASEKPDDVEPDFMSAVKLTETTKKPGASVSVAPTPAATRPVATPTPAATRPVAIPTPTPTPSTQPTPSHTAAETPKPAEPAPIADEKPDPLNSGVNLKNAEIKHKLIVKAQARIWVRYRVDNRPTMSFPMKEGAVLVLRAKDVIRFQTSNPESVTFGVNGRERKPLSGSQALITRNENATLIIPSERVETIGEPFAGAASLPKLPSSPRGDALNSSPTTE